MNINLITLNTKGRVDFKDTPRFDGCQHESIKEIQNAICEGYIVDNGTPDYELCFHLTGRMILKSAINGSDVPYNLDIKFDDFITDLVENYKKSANVLDILPILWENILLEIPIRAVNEDDKFTKTEGEGWEILDTE